MPSNSRTVRRRRRAQRPVTSRTLRGGMWKKIGNVFSRRKSSQRNKSAKPSTDAQKVDAIIDAEGDALKPQIEEFKKKHADANQFKEIMRQFPEEQEFELQVRLVGASPPACEEQRVVASRLLPTFLEFRAFIRDMTKALKRIGQTAQSAQECLKMCLSEHAAIRRWLYAILQYLDCVYAEGGECHGQTLNCLAHKSNRRRLTTLLPSFTTRQNLEILKLYKQFKNQYFKVKKDSQSASATKKRGGTDVDLFESILDCVYYVVLMVLFWGLSGSTILLHQGVTYGALTFATGAFYPISATLTVLAVYFTTKFVLSFRKMNRASKLGRESKT